MTPEGNNDWQQVNVSALRTEGAAQFQLWCVSNNNDGRAWFDDVALKLTELSAAGTVSYDQFLTEHPTHPLVVDAHLMRVQSIFTDAKWIKERGIYESEELKRAAARYAQAAAIPRLDNVLVRAVPPEKLAQAQSRYEALVDKALWRAARSAYSGRDFRAAQDHLTQIVQRYPDD